MSSTGAARAFVVTTGRLARRVVRMEIGMWQGLYRVVLRRPRVPTGARAFGYHREVMPILIVFIVVSAIEVAVVDLIVHRWAHVRVPLLIVGIWGVTWMLGLLFGYLTRPHAVGPRGLRVRLGSEVDLDLGWDVISSVAVRRDRVEGRAPRLVTEDGLTTLHLRMQRETNVHVVLEHPVEVGLPSGGVQVDAVRFFADEPRELLAAARPHLDPDQPVAAQSTSQPG